MGRHYKFRPGSHYVTDDRTGFPQRAERTRFQWNRLLVDESVWEARQPQDLVKGVKDQQSVVNARPLSPAQFVSALYYTLSAPLVPFDTEVFLQSTAMITVGDPVGVVMDTDGGAIFRTTVLFVGANFVILQDAVPGYAASGNEFVDYAPGSGVVTQAEILQETFAPILQENGHLLLTEPTV